MGRPILLSVLLVLILLFFSIPARAEIYKWVDDQGKTHFTQNPSEIPEKYRNQIPAPKPTPKPEKPKKQLGYGSDEPVEDLESESPPKAIRVEPTGPSEEPIQPAEPVMTRPPATQKTRTEAPEGEVEKPQTAKPTDVDPDSKEAVTLTGGIQMNPGEEGHAAFSGTVRNNTRVMMNSVSLAITIEGGEGKVLETLNVPVPGSKGTGFLDPAEEVSFSVQSGSGFDQIQSYRYNLKWKYVK